MGQRTKWGWIPALTLGVDPDNDRSKDNYYKHPDGIKVHIDIGEREFNYQFQTQRIIKRECHLCTETHRLIYYKRKPDPPTFHFNAYNYMKFWKDENNILGQHFNLFSTLDDALHDRNPWKHCNYDDVPGVGAFRDCGPVQLVGCQWVSDPKHGGFGIHTHKGCAKNGIFSILFDVTKMGCPPGSERVENKDEYNDISGCGLEGCNHRYETDYRDIKACKHGCDVYSVNHPGKHCSAFSWAPIAGDKNHIHNSVCTLYDSSVPTQEWGPTQVFCKNMPDSQHAYHDGGSIGHPVPVQVQQPHVLRRVHGRVKDMIKQWNNYQHFRKPMQRDRYGGGNQIISPYHQRQNVYGYGHGGYHGGYGQQSDDSSDDQQEVFPVPVVDLFIMYGGLLILCLCISGCGAFIFSAILSYFITKNNYVVDRIGNVNGKLGRDKQCV